MPHVFISYSRRDTEFVEKLEHDLNARGVVTWRDTSSIVGGEEWYRAIVRGIEDAYAVIQVVTAASTESRWVLREGLYADQLGVPTIPVLPAPCPIPFHLIATQPIPFDDYDSGLARLVAALNSLPKTTPAGRKPAGTSIPASTADEIAYLDFLLAETKADLKTARYVSLSAEQQRPTAHRTEPAKPAWDYFPDEDDLVFKRVVDVECVRGEDFDRPGDLIPDARLPLREMKRVILLGEPGSGKTTTLLQLAIDLAREAKTTLEAGKPAPLLPVFLPLRSYTGEEPFGDFVRKRLFTLQSQYERLLAGGRLVLLCDALNEMQRHANGRDLVAEVRSYLHERQPWVVSCRVRDYQEELKDLSDVGKVRLKPLDLPRIKDVVDRRFSAEAERAAALWADLKGSDDLLAAWQAFEAVDKTEAFWEREWPETLGNWYDNKNYPLHQARQTLHADPRRMMLLCRSPYMLFMVCSTFERAGKLPDNRGALFADFVENLLIREERTSRQTGRAWTDAAIIRRALAQLAYAMQISESGTEITRAEAERILSEQPDVTDPALLLRLAGAASLLDVGEGVRYTHQLLQEYFASEIMGGVMTDHRPAAQFWPPDRWWEPQGWEETALILAGVRGDPEEVARWIAPAQPEVAYQVLTECGIETDLDRIAPDTRAALVGSADSKKTEPNPVGRAAAYRVLGRFRADTRQGIGLRPDGLPDIDWVEIPAGEFIFQEDQRLTLPAFHISRYPITYAQYGAFVNDNGYAVDKYWTLDGLNWRGDKRCPEYLWNDPRWHIPNHPVVGVTWYEACAFTQWLNARFPLLRPNSVRQGEGPGIRAIRLPTEAEWEKAARGTEGLIYPYGNEFDAAKGNTSATGIRRTSAAGIFPAGASPYGVLDMSGNVWHWCLTKWRGNYGEPEDNDPAGAARRVLRGGSWYLDQYYARAVSRFDPHPNDRDYGRGFRVVVASPI